MEKKLSTIYFIRGEKGEQMMKAWQSALALVSAALAQADIDWLVVGSVASVLHGCPFEPNDLDLLFPDLVTLQLAERAINQALAIAEESAIQTQTFGEFKWHKRYWQLNGFPIDASYIESGGGIPDSPDGAGVWEGGVHVWKYREEIRTERGYVPVPHLSVQLESQLRRGMLARAAVIKQLLRERDDNDEIAQRCLSRENYQYLRSV